MVDATINYYVEYKPTNVIFVMDISLIDVIIITIVEILGHGKLYGGIHN